jgi:hypothetical protein
MSKPTKDIRSINDTARELSSNIAKVAEALFRITCAAASKEYSPQVCAYIDTQCAKAIAWLASARAVVITHGELTDPAFDDGSLWDLDDEIGLITDAAARAERGRTPS